MLNRLKRFFDRPPSIEHISPDQSLGQVHWLLEKIIQDQHDFLRSHSSYVFTQKLLALTKKTELLQVTQKRDHVSLSLEDYDDLKDFPGCLHLNTVVKQGTGLPYHTRGLFYLDSPSQALSQIDMVVLDNNASIFDEAQKNIPRPKLQEWVDCGIIQLPNYHQHELSLYFAAGSTFNQTPRHQPIRRSRPFPVLIR